MDLNALKKVYLIGIGGIGMSALARYFHQKGLFVSGYDRTKTELTIALEQEGIQIGYEDFLQQVPREFHHPEDTTLIIYTPAIPKESSIYQYFINKPFLLKKRSEVLGILSKNMFTIAVAGTHGKTTTSCLLAHVLKHSGYDCSAFLGGICANYNTNMLLGESNLLVIEADEYDRSFLALSPDIAVITSTDPDHLDVYGTKRHVVNSYQSFASKLKAGGSLIHKYGLPFNQGVTYAIDEEKAFVQARHIRVQGGVFYFDFVGQDVEILNLSLSIPGLHNIENALAVIEVALLLGIPKASIKKALASFSGVKRRFEYILKEDYCIYIDDYAHHPKELSACINTIKTLYPEKTLITVFQPHLYSRTKDFINEFADVLNRSDELILLDIYPAREAPIPGVSSKLLIDKVKISKKYLCNKEAAVDLIKSKKPELLLTVGAGDISDLVKPLELVLKHA